MKNGIYTLLSICLLLSLTETSAQVTSDKLNYIENKGQWPSQVSHMAKIGGGAVWLEKNKAKYPINLSKGNSTKYNKF